MKILISFSGGKDSQACLIWAVKKYGPANITAVYMDTGWENPITYDHIHKITDQLNVKLIILKSAKYSSLVDLARKRKRFPSTKAKFCSQELKVFPFIDFILDHVQDHFISIEGVRAQESHRRSKMDAQCRYFRYYFEPYSHDKDGNPKHYTYRKKEIIEFCKKYSDDLLRPIFDWSADQVIQYILDNNQEPNPLYKMGFSRVGCFPCIMANMGEVRQIMQRYPEKIEEIKKLEKEIGSFFKPDYIPERFRTGKDKNDKTFSVIEDIVKYLQENNATGDLFETEAHSCASHYGLCE